MLPLVPALLLTAFIGLLIGKSFNPYFFCWKSIFFTGNIGSDIWRKWSSMELIV